MNVGLAYLQLREYPQAIRHYQQARTLADAIGQPLTVAHSLNNIGFAYLEMGDYSLALPYLEKALTLVQTLHDQGLYVNILENIALVRKGTHQPKQALTLLEEALHVAQATRQKDLIRNIHRTTSEVYTDLANYQQALTHYQQAMLYQDSLFSEKKTEQIAEMETRYEVDKKEQQIAAQEQEIAWLARTKHVEERLRLVLIVAVGLLFLLIVFVYRQYRLKRRSAQLLDGKNREIRGEKRSD